MQVLSEVKWFNTESRRVYRCIAGKDLLGDWFVTRYWNSADSAQGGYRTSIHKNKNDVLKAIVKLSKERARNGYEEVR